MSDHIAPDSDYFLTKDDYKERSLDHLPPSLILFRARLAAIESGKHQVVINNLDEIIFEGFPIFWKYLIFKPTGQLDIPAYGIDCEEQITAGQWDMFYKIGVEREA